ncbi:Vegetative incompatibility protein HET-E-1 [Colletotrichum siamense]|uniref:Vegetative incompatibility protein HET-E-1 n=1 Tax=Colletotrichum siamense TaxID=690259 RepID=UPI001872FBEF|nr:Vegetative incompatibility protein HET-E-1 [Colletotrichum siamense]KAF5489753.1 Vegetative incompatibility protein HET-E-1 [Colletotrichum siamense]
MRLIETTTLAMETHLGRDVPPYVILSHTWEDEEVTLQDWNSPTRDGMKGFHKIRMTCQLAACDGIKYAWVDTCCIDKSNSAELSEAINSMYRWYKGAKVCYTYLSDLCLHTSAALESSMDRELSIKSESSVDSESSIEPDDSVKLEGSIETNACVHLEPFLRGCRWFYRGWTLQELVAPAVVLFYQHDWGLVGNKADWRYILSNITGIPYDAMVHYQLSTYSIAERMSWAAGRETSREEDMAYCLLGIFDINMPMLYGEGRKAFRRLQEEIIRTSHDVTIFAWTRTYPGSEPRLAEGLNGGVFAQAPGEFHPIPGRDMWRQPNEVTVTNAGLKLTLDLCLARMPHTGELSYVLPVCFYGCDGSRLGVELGKISSSTFVRKNIETLVVIPNDGETNLERRIRCPDSYILIDAQFSMVLQGMNNNINPHWLYFAFPLECTVIRAWPSDRWDAAKSAFIASFGEPNCGSILVEVQIPTLVEDDDDGIARQSQTGEFMFLFNRLPCPDNSHPMLSTLDLQCTILGYREHQLKLDVINMRIAAGDMGAGEMRRTLRNFAIPRQREASIPVDGLGRFIYASVDYVENWQSKPPQRCVFRGSSAAL